MATQEMNEGAYLEMSDEDLMKMSAPADVPATEPEVVEPTADNEEVAEATTSEVEATAVTEELEPSGTDESAADKLEEVAESTTTAEIAQVEPEVKADTAAPEKEIDYKAAYQQLFAPFKANGKDIAVDSVEDAIALMQMGANYNKKMAGMKPSLKLLKLLENNGLLDEAKLSYLIDLDKKNPEAVHKLIKDSGIDPLDIGVTDGKEYTPKKYVVDDSEIELDTVLDELQDSPTYTRTLDVVSNKWDGPSKQVIANSPQILKVINNHMQSGIYDLIHTEMERERVFGRLNGLSDIEAYRRVGDAIQARGGFNHLGNQGQQTTPAPVVVTPKPKPVDDAKLKDKRLAASGNKPAGPSTAPVDFNPLALSDEEFAKQGNSKYL